MKHWTRKLTVSALALSLALGQTALASEALGHDLHTGRTILSQGTAVTRSHFWSDTYNDLRTERYVTYTPNEAVSPSVAYGENLLSRATLSDMAQVLESQGKRVVGGTNGDFYVVSTGQPLGMVVTEGVLRSSSSYHPAVGFRADGSAFVGTPNLYISAVMLGERLTVFGGVNKIRQIRTADGGGLTLLSEDFGATTRNTVPGVDVILRPIGAAEDEPEGADEDQVQTIEEPPGVPLGRAAETGPEETSAAETTAPEQGETEGDAPEQQTPGDSPMTPEEGADRPETDPEQGFGEGEDTPPEQVPQVKWNLGQTIPAEATGLGRELVVTDALRIGGRVRCRVDYVTEAAGANEIPKGCFILTMNGQDDEGTLNMLRTLQPGDEVDIDIVSEDRRWEEAVEALGGMYRLLENGQMGEGLSHERTARTAIGVKADGTVIFYTIDGRQPGYSVGATFPQVAQRLLELGCVEAVGLDGGGSTTIGVTTTDSDAMRVVNSPSDGWERANSVAVFLTTELTATGEPAYLQVEPGDALLLAGATLPLGAYRVDTGYRLMDAAPETEFEAEGGGSVEGSLFTAGAEDAHTVITARQGTLTGQALITTVRTPDEIKVNNEITEGPVYNLALDPGQIVPLRASAVWRGLPVQSQDGNYTWSCDEAVGTIAPDGTFTAGSKTASGEIAVAAGDKLYTIPVNVTGHILPLEDMEEEETIFSAGMGTTLAVNTDLTRVRAGRQSLRVDYDTGEAGVAVVEAGATIPAGERYVGLWVYGDGSANSLMALFAGPEREEAMLLCGLGFTGWRHILVPVPEGCDTLWSLQVLYGGGETGTGTLWLDQVTTANEDLEDVTPPFVDVTVNGSQLTATVSDNVDRSIPQEAVVLQYDGAPLTGSWNAETGTLSATLPEPGSGGHRITVTAMDVSGNIGRGSYDIPGETQVSFADMLDHWAAGYAGYLYEQGITNGVDADEGLYYLPNNNITRAEFFTMAARWMGLDLSLYADVELPFTDLGEIPEWALGPVKAVYQLGIVQGSLDMGVLYLYPNSGISRSEVMTILGRTQPRGYPQAELESFTDWEQTPEWAESYVGSLVGQGIINGYEDGTLKPNALMTRGEAAKILWALR